MFMILVHNQNNDKQFMQGEKQLNQYQLRVNQFCSTTIVKQQFVNKNVIDGKLFHFIHFQMNTVINRFILPDTSNDPTANNKMKIGTIPSQNIFRKG